MRFLSSFFASAFIAAAAASNVLELSPTNFDSVIGKGKPGLVEFYATWCGHCKSLAPTYEELADAFAYAKDRVVIGKLDADGPGRAIGQKYGIRGFPTLKWIDEVGKEVEEYNGPRDVESLAAFVTKHSGVKSKLPGPPEPSFEILHENNFNEITQDPTKHVLVSYTVEAPWCSDCKDVKLIWEKVANWYKNDNVVIGNVNLDEPRNSRLTGRHGIDTYPTIKFFAKGNKKPEIYEGGKTEKDIVAYLNKKTGANRVIGGGLNLVAGRIAELDELAEKFTSASKATRLELLKEAKQVVDKVGPTGPHYIKIMEKVVNGTTSYVDKERKRLKVIAAKADGKKQDEIKVKDNILRAFQNKAARDKYDL